MPRLPEPGSDEGSWGQILNEYLSQTHAPDGTLKDNAVTSASLAPGAVTAAEIQDGQITENKLSSAVQTKLNSGGGGAVTSVAGKTGAVTLVKGDVGLGNVDNTSDASKNTASATLTNKTISGANNTLTNIPQTSVTGLQTALGAKADTNHSHAISAVSGLQTELDSKAGTSHAHAISAVTGLQTELDGKAAASHSHAISAVTGLQAALDAKQASGSYAAASHSHTSTDISDSTSVGRSLLTAPDAAAGRTALGVAQSGLTGLPAGVVLAVTWSGTAWRYNGSDIVSRPTARTDLTIMAIGGSTAPGWLITGDVWMEDIA